MRAFPSPCRFVVLTLGAVCAAGCHAIPSVPMVRPEVGGQTLALTESSAKRVAGAEAPASKRAADDGGVGSRGRFALRIAPGTADVDIGPPTNFQGDTDALAGGLEFEMVSGGGFGGGIQLDYWSSDTDLFRRQLPTRQTSATGLRVMPHATLGPRWNRGRLPIRIGPEILAQNIESVGSGSASVDWVGVGVHLQLEPEFDFFRNDGAAMSIYGRVGGGVGAAVVNTTLNSNDYSTTYTSYVVEAGLRLQLEAFLLAAGYMARGVLYDQSDSIGLSFAEATDFVFAGAFFEMGLRW